MRSIRVALALAVALPTAGLAQTIITRAPDGREIRRKCENDGSVKSLPSLGSMIDSAAAFGVAAGAAGSEGEGWVLSLSYAPGSKAALVRWLEPESGPAEVTDRLSALATPRAEEQVLAVRLRFRFRKNVGLSLEPGLYCPPVRALPSTGSSGVGTVVVSPGDRVPTPGSAIKVAGEAVILADGTVTEARISRSSGIAELDAEVLRDLQTARFLPALLNGIPVTGRYRTNGDKLPR